MSGLRRIVLIRHGETVGNSSERLHGSADLALSPSGIEQMRRAAASLRTEVFELVVASTLRRSWEGAQIVSGGAPIRLEHDFREIHFGRWEGLTRSEIEASDPIAHRDWQARKPGFEFPGGEPRAQFRARVARGLERLQACGADAALVVVHRGVIRALAEQLLGAPLADATPSLGEVVALSRTPGGAWYRGRHGSNPEALEPVSVSA
ncbi:MAG TPA: histidine phosphatase family protein [Myxococcota bacterium]|jgi:broad specificity phosphatase PhoE